MYGSLLEGFELEKSGLKESQERLLELLENIHGGRIK